MEKPLDFSRGEFGDEDRFIDSPLDMPEMGTEAVAPAFAEFPDMHIG